MDLIMETENLAVIEELLCKYLDLPLDTNLAIENLVSEKHNSSEFTHFSLAKQPEPSLPAKLVLKTNRSSGREVSFYQAALNVDTELPLVRCLGGKYDLPSGQSHVLLEDLALSHSNLCDWPSPAPLQAGYALVEALAELHAAFWTRPGPDGRLDLLPEFLQDETSYQAHIGYLKRDFEIYASGIGSGLDKSQIRVYLEILNLMPDLWNTFWKPRLSAGPLPLIHGDLNPCNVLYPNHSGDGKVAIIDWEACRRGLPAGDLAVLFGLHLCPDFEDAHPFLLHYQQHLSGLGVKDYSIENLLADYEICLLYELFTPLKLYAHMGIQDECMIQNSITALESIRDAGF